MRHFCTYLSGTSSRDHHTNCLKDKFSHHETSDHTINSEHFRYTQSKVSMYLPNATGYLLPIKIYLSFAWYYWIVQNDFMPFRFIFAQFKIKFPDMLLLSTLDRSSNILARMTQSTSIHWWALPEIFYILSTHHNCVYLLWIFNSKYLKKAINDLQLLKEKLRKTELVFHFLILSTYRFHIVFTPS